VSGTPDVLNQILTSAHVPISYTYSAEWAEEEKKLKDGMSAFSRGDFQTALKLLQPVAERGHEVAQVYVSDIFERGCCGVEQNDAESYFWQSLAAQSGYTTRNSIIANKLTPEQKAAVETRVKEWAKAHPNPPPP
jgi:TPR repeat protein